MPAPLMLTVAWNVLLSGCAPYVQIKSDLVEESRRGVRLVQEAAEGRQGLIEQLLAVQRRRLDDAFDADARQREAIDAEWVITARKAYAVGVDALGRQAEASRRAHAVTAGNLAAVEAALAQLQMLHEIERRLSLPRGMGR